MSNYYQDRARALVNGNLYMLLSSANPAGRPWATPVYFTVGNELTFYWTSDKNSQHSMNVRENPSVFLVVYNSTAPEGKYVGEGLYLEAIAVELDNNDEVQAARALTQSRKGVTVDETEYQRFTGNAVRRVYKAVPSRAWVNDVENDQEGKYIRDIRVEVALDKLRENLA